MRLFLKAGIVSFVAFQAATSFAGITVKESSFEKVETVAPSHLKSIHADAGTKAQGAKDKANLEDWKLVDRNVDDAGRLKNKKTARTQVMIDPGIYNPGVYNYNYNGGVSLYYATNWNSFPIYLTYYYPPQLTYDLWLNYQPLISYNAINVINLPSYWNVWQPPTWNYVSTYYVLPQVVTFNPLPTYQVVFRI